MPGQTFDSVPAFPTANFESTLFLQTCLALDEDQRPAVIEVFNDVYHRGEAKKPNQGGMPAEGDTGGLETAACGTLGEQGYCFDWIGRS